MIKTLVLDFDGTLGDSKNLITHTFIGTISTLGLNEKTMEDCSSTIGLPLRKAFETLYPEENNDFYNNCVTTYRKLFDINNVKGAVPPFPHVKETMKYFHEKGFTQTIASSRGKDSLPILIKELGIEPYISYTLSAEDVKNAKPHPEPVLKTIAYLGIKADECLVVGDATFDILMGKSAGAHTCAVTYGNGKKEELIKAGAEWVIDDFIQLKDIVLSQ